VTYSHNFCTSCTCSFAFQAVYSRHSVKEQPTLGVSAFLIGRQTVFQNQRAACLNWEFTEHLDSALHTCRPILMCNQKIAVAYDVFRTTLSMTWLLQEWAVPHFSQWEMSYEVQFTSLCHCTLDCHGTLANRTPCSS
jgi:hypothetical protein